MAGTRVTRDRDSNYRRRRSRSRSGDLEEEQRQRRRRRDRDSRGQYDERDVVRNRHKSSRDEIEEDSRHKRSHRRSRSPRDEHVSRGRRDDSEERTSLKDREARHRAGDLEKIISRRAAGPLPSQEASFSANHGGELDLSKDGPPPEKQKPSLAPTGLLAAASNTVAQVDGSSVVLKYHEPPEARKPSAKDQWKLFVFKGSDIIDTVDLSVRSCWLVGRELSVVDLAAEHPSISKQHAVIQFRYIEKRNEFGDKIGKVKPYLIDLESANGTKLNKEEIPPSRYLELRDKDLVQFGDSTREYVLMLPPR